MNVRCVDASVAVKWVLVDEEHSERALGLLADSTVLGERLIAPPLVQAEVTNIIRRAMLEDGLDLPDATALLRRFLAFPLRLSHRVDLLERALVIADRFGLRASYDAQYLALAEAEACDFWTDDRRLIRSLAGRLPYVRWIGDFTS